MAVVAEVSLAELRSRAEAMGVEAVEGMNMAELVHAIQAGEGNRPCFDSEWCNRDWRERCAWKHDCRAKDYFMS